MAIYLRTDKPTKVGLIREILDYWDPCRKRAEAGPMYYNYEAGNLAQNIRKNSKVDSVAKKVREEIDWKLEAEGLDYIPLEDEDFAEFNELLDAREPAPAKGD